MRVIYIILSLTVILLVWLCDIKDDIAKWITTGVFTEVTVFFIICIPKKKNRQPKPMYIKLNHGPFNEWTRARWYHKHVIKWFINNY